MRELTLGRIQLDNLIGEISSFKSSLRFKVTVTGSCMLPFIRHGDALTFVPMHSCQFRVGDIIVYRPNGAQLFAHRIVSIKNKNGCALFETRGDATFGYKETINEKHILGRAITVHRKNELLNQNHPCRRLTALLWIKGAFILYIARRGKSIYTARSLVA